jgi:hypothetical protein
MFDTSELVHSHYLLNDSDLLNALWNDERNREEIEKFLNNEFCTKQAEDDTRSVPLLKAYRYYFIVWTHYLLFYYI